MTTPDRLDEITARLDAATPFVSHQYDIDEYGFDILKPGEKFVFNFFAIRDTGGVATDEDFHLLAHAGADLRWCLAEIRRLRADRHAFAVRAARHGYLQGHSAAPPGAEAIVAGLEQEEHARSREKTP